MSLGAFESLTGAARIADEKFETPLLDSWDNHSSRALEVTATLTA